MDKREIQELLVQIKIFFPRFDAVEKTDGQFRINPAVTDSWYDRIGWMEKERAFAILDRYMEDETKTPGITLWMQNGKTTKGSNAWHSAVLDRRHGVIVWRPEGSDEVFEIPVRHPLRVIGFDNNRKPIMGPDESTWEDEDGRLWAIPEVET